MKVACPVCSLIVAVSDSLETVSRSTSVESAPTNASAPPELAYSKHDRDHFPGFDILDELGRGGMGIVYRAFDRARKEIVALKTIKGLDTTAVHHLKQEFRTLADITHPNLVTLHELISDGYEWFLTMELVDGSDFLTYVRSAADTFSCLRDALRQLVEGVSALHRAGILHRDIKPSNVRVTREGRIVLLDFGLAAPMQECGQYQTIEQHVVGTFAYMAPEQAEGSPVSPASDWYSVGVILYQALTGNLPFSGNSYRILAQKRQTDAPDPSETVAGLPEDLNALCNGLLRRDAKERLAEQQVREILNIPPPERAMTARHSMRERTPLLGRGEQLAALHEGFKSMRAGKAVALMLQGRSGMGKTALMQHFLHDLSQSRQAVVLSGRCYEHEAVPYKALDNLIDALTQYLRQLPYGEVQALLPRYIHSLVRLFPSLGQIKAIAQAPHPPLDIPDRQELRRYAVASLRELLSRIADRRPVVLAIDDLQWGDVDSGVLLLDLLRPPDPPVLLLICAYRSEDLDTSPCLKLLLHAAKRQEWIPDQRLVTVQSLSPEDSRRLALKTLDRVDSTATVLADRISQEAAGDPLFVQELVRHVQGQISRPSRAIALPISTLSLESVLWQRIKRLPEPAYKLLEIIAITGRPLIQTTACQAAELGPESWGILTLLRSERLIRGTGMALSERLETYHDRIRETVVANLAPEELKSCHRRLAEALEFDAANDPEELAAHYEAAGETVHAGELYAKAAVDAASALAFDRAAKLYASALRLLPETDRRRRGFRLGLAESLANAGRGEDAAREYLAVAQISNPTEGLELQRLGAMHFLFSGHIDEGLEQLEAVLRRLGMRLPKASWRVLGSLLVQRLRLRFRGLRYRERASSAVPPELLQKIDTCWSIAAGLGLVDPLLAAVFSSRGLLLSIRAGEPHRLAGFLSIEAAQAAIAGPRKPRRARQLLSRVDAVAKNDSSPHTEAMVKLGHGAVDWLHGNWRQAGKACEEAFEILRTGCTGVWWEINLAQTVILNTAHFMGEMQKYERCRRDIILEARNRGDLYALTIAGAMILPVLAADQPDVAEREVNELVSHWSRAGFHVQHFYAMYSLMEIALYRGDGIAAWKLATDHRRLVAGSLLLRVQSTRILSYDSRSRCALAAAAGMSDPKPLLRIADRYAKHLEHEKVAWADGLARLIYAGVAAFRKDWNCGVTHLNRAIESFTTSEMGLHAAVSRWRMGELLGGDRGTAIVAEARAWMTEQGIRNPARMTAMHAPMPVRDEER